MPEQWIRTARLELVPGTPRFLKADREGNEALASALDVIVPPAWPPSEWKDTVEEFLLRVERHPGLIGWLNWYMVLADGGVRTLIGSGGFTGAPFNGQLMIGYAVLEEFRHRGYGSEAVDAMVNWAMSKPGVRIIVAETDAHNEMSIRLLERCGFEYTGKGFESGTIRYALLRDKWLLSRR